MSNLTAQVWNACGYVRLSREDGDKEESNSVTGQKQLIRDYFCCHPELRECGMKVDDGYTGSNFDRPGFQAMMAEIKAGKYNCVVVKDLSRFGREYLESGEYIERIFPFLGVRFIAINDHYDSLCSNAGTDDLMVPFINLVNSAYCRDTSIKIRSQLEIKRKSGDFIGSFAVFGYRKDPEDHHRLLVDDYAAGIVQDIFKWKLEGISAADIAVRLNASGFPTPLDYKKAQGLHCYTPFRVKAESEWSTGMVLRILKNPTYIGVLEQGRVTTLNYRDRKRVNKPPSQWSVVPDHHEAIIDPTDFESVQRVLALDTRTTVSGQAVELFSGMVFCGECGAAMIRKTIPAGKKKYVYLVCSAHKAEKTVCSSHSIRNDTLEEIVLELVQQHIQDVIDLSDLMDMTSVAQLQQVNMRKLKDRLDKKQEEISRCQTLLCSLYESLADGVLSKEEYLELKQTYTRRREEAEAQTELLQREMSAEIIVADGREWMEQFRKRQGITKLDRSVVAALIERVLIYRDRRVEVIFRWHDEYRHQRDLCFQAQCLSGGSEAV